MRDSPKNGPREEGISNKIKKIHTRKRSIDKGKEEKSKARPRRRGTVERV